MDPDQYRNDPTLGEAMAALAQMEAQEAGPGQTAPPAAQPTPASANPGASAPEPGKETGQPSDSKAPSGAATTDTPATADPPTTTDKPKEGEPPKPAESKPNEPQQSRFAKNQQRLEGSWKQLNERKAELAKAEETLKQRTSELTQRERKLEQDRQKLNQPKYKPEDYEASAAGWEREAAALEQRATRLEAEGKFDEADKAKAAAANKRNTAGQAREYAGHLRANPPPAPKTDEQAEADFRAQQKEWWGKAAIDFPAVAKAGTPEAEALKALIKSTPQIANDPQFMYWAARMAVAETAAARVPALVKELEEFRAKTDKLSKALAVPSESATPGVSGEVPFEQRTADEQEAELYRMAEALDASGRR